MLWLAIHLPLLSLTALNGADTEAKPGCVVTARRGARRWAIAATQTELQPGTDWSTVQLLYPDLRAYERRPRAEREALQTLAAWAYRYGSELIWELAEADEDYGLPCACVWVEIGASLNLYGGLEGLLADFSHTFPETGHHGVAGVAPTPEAALLLARAGGARVADPAQLAAALSPLPLAALPLAPETRTALTNVGLSTLGDLLPLPAAAVARRYGRALVLYLDSLLGRRPDVRPRYRLPAKYQRRFDLLSEVEHAEGLLFPLQRLTRELADYLRARDTGLQEFRLVLHHGRGSGGRAQADTTLVLRLATPGRDSERLLRVIREQLARQPLPAPVRTLRLHAEQFIEPAAGQRDLFADPRSDEAWGQLLEKLVARLGDDAVTALGLADDHRPERCWRATPSDAPPAPPLPPPAVARPVWLIDPPRPLPSPPPCLGEAERIEGGWWDGGDVVRDYYQADLHGGRLWVFQERSSRSWYLQGIWA